MSKLASQVPSSPNWMEIAVAALSVRRISGQPIKFVGVGEKVEALQPFYPERMASRILGWEMS